MSDSAADANASANAEWAALFERSRRLTEEWSGRNRQNGEQALQVVNTEIVRAVFSEVAAYLKDHPEKLAAAQHRLAGDYAKIWASMMAGSDPDVPIAPVIQPERGDRRFSDPAWRDNRLFNGLMQYHLVTAKWMNDVIESLDGLDAVTRQKAGFYARQMLSALSPTNFLATNPAAIQEAVSSGGAPFARLWSPPR